MVDTVKFRLLDVSYKVIDGKPQVFLWGRTLDNKRICVVDDSFQPYFYVLLKSLDDVDSFCSKVVKLVVDHDDRQVQVVHAEIVDKKFLGKNKRVIKVFVKLPSDVPVVRSVIKDWDLISSILEFDIPFVRRYLTDKKFSPLSILDAVVFPFALNLRVPCYKSSSIESFSSDSVDDPRILAFDIETYNPSGKRFLPEKHPVIMVAFYGLEKGLPFKKVITWKRFKTDLDYVEFVDGELELLERFKNVINKFKPDVLSGYFSDGFDFPYLLTRAKNYKVDLDINLDYSPVKYSKRTKNIQLTGIVHFDVFKFISKVMGRSLNTDSFSLDNVSEELLGERKDDVDINLLAGAWDDKSDLLSDFAKYNLKDAFLTFKLAHKILPNIEELVKIVGLPMWDVNRMSFSQLVEWFIFKQVQDFNELAPNRPSYFEVNDRKEESYQGAFVFEPRPGLYDDIVVFDFRSLYPTIIASHNICLSTLQCHCCPDAKKVPIKEYEYWFCKKKKGFLPSIIQDLITRRMRVKEIMKEKKDPMLSARSDSLKLLANSFYGYLAFFGARWYCVECARSTTALARFYITDTIAKAQNQGFEVLYSDTDSIFISLKNKDESDALHFMEGINQDLPEMMELEFEGFYPRAIFGCAKEAPYGAKKKYALLDSSDKLKITGFETVRRNWSEISKDVQREVLNIILKEKDTKKAVSFVKQVVLDLRAKKIPNNKVIIHTVLQKELKDYSSIGPHVAVAQKMFSQGEDVGKGSSISYIIAQGQGRIRDKAKLPNEIDKNYDSEYYINNQVIPAVQQIFDVLGVSKDELLSANQSKLGEFF